MKRVVTVLSCACALHAGVASAQGTGQPLSGGFEISAAVPWTGTTAFASRDASLTGAAGTPFRLFSTSTELAGGRGSELRISRRVVRSVEAEVSASYTSPALTTSVTNDVEGGAATIASESITQITVEVAAVVALPRWNVGSRLLPFVTGGGGYLRQLHEGETLADTGRIYHVGGGVRVPLISRGDGHRLKQVGLRADVRAVVRTGGITIDGLAHTAPAIAVSAFVRF